MDASYFPPSYPPRAASRMSWADAGHPAHDAVQYGYAYSSDAPAWHPPAPLTPKTSDVLEPKGPPAITPYAWTSAPPQYAPQPPMPTPPGTYPQPLDLQPLLLASHVHDGRGNGPYAGRQRLHALNLGADLASGRQRLVKLVGSAVAVGSALVCIGVVVWYVRYRHDAPPPNLSGVQHLAGRCL